MFWELRSTGRDDGAMEGEFQESDDASLEVYLKGNSPVVLGKGFGGNMALLTAAVPFTSSDLRMMNFHSSAERGKSAISPKFLVAFLTQIS